MSKEYLDKVKDILRALTNDYTDSLVRKKLLNKSLDEYAIELCQLKPKSQ